MIKSGACLFLLMLIAAASYSQQWKSYSYQRELGGVTDQWHKVVLPDDIFGKVANDLADIKIFGVTVDNDTIEAPYVLQVATEKVANNAVPFKQLNTAHNESGFYFTFEVPTAAAINRIYLDFEQQNFDWKLKLEGSQDQREWYTVVEDYRILSIKNANTDFQFTNINFPQSKYRFFRVSVASKEAPILNTAGISMREFSAGAYRTYPIQSINTREKKDTKQTEISLTLPMAVPLSQLQIEVLDSFDYYRPLTIQYCTDSIKTEQGWKYKYRPLSSGTLNSLEESTFQFSEGLIVKKLKILIHNSDNQALNIGTIIPRGYVHELVARFNIPASYYLAYGAQNARKPQYDIVRFLDKIPGNSTAVTLGPEQTITKSEQALTAPLFENKVFLWGLMFIIILLLGGFTLKMMNGN